MKINDLEIGTCWYVQLSPKATLVEFEVLETTELTVLLRQIKEIRSNYDISRYRFSDIEFIEKSRNELSISK